MVCIIDDREDVWQGCGNLVQVKPYYFFRHTANINAPPGMNKLDDPNEPGSSANSESSGAESDDEKNGVIEGPSEVEAKEVPEEMEITENVKNQEIQEEVVPSEKAIDDLKTPETKDETTDKEMVDETVKQKLDNETTNKKVEDETNVEKVESNMTDKIAEENRNEETPEIKESESNLEPVKELKEVAKKEGGVDYEDQDDYLLYLEDILRRIHTEYYTDIEKETGRRSLRDIIPRVRARVLKGLILTFSGIIPTHQKLHQSRAYKVARAFGAQVTQVRG